MPFLIDYCSFTSFKVDAFLAFRRAVAFISFWWSCLNRLSLFGCIQCSIYIYIQTWHGLMSVVVSTTEFRNEKLLLQTFNKQDEVTVILVIMISHDFHLFMEQRKLFHLCPNLSRYKFIIFVSINPKRKISSFIFVRRKMQLFLLDFSGHCGCPVWALLVYFCMALRMVHQPEGLASNGL